MAAAKHATSNTKSSSSSSSKPLAPISAWRHNALPLAYYAAVAAGLAWVVVHAVLGRYTLWRGALLAAAFGWAVLLCLCMWPPVSTLMPREETEQGWRIK
jgi:4-amino-4-deoxy-L-arabinose transferase-like glycosyltransferase